jgi:hypothetical protein
MAYLILVIQKLIGILIIIFNELFIEANISIKWHDEFWLLNPDHDHSHAYLFF